MPLGHAQVLAKLKWEVACERLRSTIEPPEGVSASTVAERLQAYRLAQQALEAVRQASEIEANAYSALPALLAPSRKPDEQAGAAQSS